MSILHQFDNIYRESFPEGRLPHIPSSRSTDYVFWTAGGWTHHGALVSMPGVSSECGKSVTIASKHIIGGMWMQDGIYTSHAIAPNDANVTLCSAVTLAGNTIRLKVSNGFASIGYLLGTVSPQIGDLSSYDHRYLLSAGMSSTPGKNLVYVDGISEVTGGKYDVVVGDKFGTPVPTYRTSVDTLLAKMDTGISPAYLYARSANFDFATAVESYNTPGDHCILMLQGGEADGVTTIVDKSLAPRTLDTSDVEYSTDLNLLGNSCIKFLSSSAYIDVDNSDDSMLFSSDFTIRMVGQFTGLAKDSAHRLFYSNTDNYADLYAPSRIKGMLCGKSFDVTAPYADFSRPTTIAIGRSGGIVRVVVNRYTVASFYSSAPFGGSSSLSADITTGGTVFASPLDTTSYTGSFVALFDGTHYYGWRTEGNTSPQYCGYELASSAVVKGYGLFGWGQTTHLTTSTNVPTAWLFQGSNDGTEWDTLDHQSAQNIYSATMITYKIQNTESYSMYRFLFLATADPDNKVSISSAAFYTANELSTNTTFRLGSNTPGTVPSIVGYLMDLQVNAKDIADEGIGGLPEFTRPPAHLHNAGMVSLVHEKVDTFKYLWQPTTDASANATDSPNILADDTSFWDPSATAAWIEVDMSSADMPMGCSSYDIAIPAGDTTVAPTAWTLTGYTGASWITIDSKSSVSDWADGEKKNFTVYRHNKEFSKYKVTITAVNGGSTVKISNLAVHDYFRSKEDTGYSSLDRTFDTTSVRSGEVHLSSNNEWTVVSDTASSLSATTVHCLPPADNDTIMVDNTGRPAYAGALISVPVSWGGPYTLLDGTGTEVPYIFVDNSLVTSETVAANIRFRLDLAANTMYTLSVDTGSSPSSFLTEDDIFDVSSGTIDDGYSQISLVSLEVDGDPATILSNNLATPYLLPFSAGYSYSPTKYAGGYDAYKAIGLRLDDNGIFVSGGGTATTRILYASSPDLCELPDCTVSHTGAAGTTWTSSGVEYVGVWVGNALYVYNCDTRTWSNPAVTGNTLQSATYGFGYAGSGTTLYMYGGRDGSNNLYSQLCKLDTASNVLSVETITGTVPPAMSYSAMALISSGQKLILSGGSYETGAVQTADVALVSDQLKITSNAAAGHSGNIYRSECVYADFSVEVSFADLTTITATGRMAVLDMIVDHSSLVYIGSNGTQWTYWDGTSHTAARSATYGAVRISRAGTTLTFAYKDGANDWVTMGTKVLSSSPMHAALRCAFTGTGQYATFDDFKIDGAIVDDFTGTGTPSSMWVVNKDLFADIDRSTDVYVIDTTTLVSTKYSPATVPFGQFSMVVFNNPAYLGGSERLFAYDSEQLLYELDLSTFVWTKLTWSGTSPKVGEYPIIASIGSEGPVNKDQIIVAGGNATDTSIASIDVGGCTANIDLTFDSSIPKFLSIGYETAAHHTAAPYIDVYSGTTHIGHSYDICGNFLCHLDNDDTVSTLRVKLSHPGANGQTINITSIKLFDDVRYARAYSNSVVSFSSGTELVAPASSGNVPTTTLDHAVSSTGGTAQKYVVEDSPIHASYVPAGSQVSYPYSIVLATTDELQKSLTGYTIGSIGELSSGDVRWAFSFDGRATWETFDGSVWTTIDITNLSTFRTSGITRTILVDADISSKVTDTVDVAVLLNVSASGEQAWFSTVSISANTDGERDISPSDLWLTCNIGSSGQVLCKDHGVSNEAVLNAYDRAVGIHPLATSTISARDVSVHAIISRYNAECMQIMPAASSYYAPHILSGSLSAFISAYAFGNFDSSTESVRLASSYVVASESTQSMLRRSFGRDGMIIALHGPISAGQGEHIDSSTMSLSYINMGTDIMGGDGASLGGENNAWLTPGYRNSSTSEWYNSMTKVVYSTAQIYLDQRCSITAAHSVGAGAVSDKTYGWILGGSSLTYSLLKLDYAADTAGLTSVASVDVSGLTETGVYRTIGCSSLSSHTGLFVLSHNEYNTAKVVALDYANDTTTRNVRSMPSLVGGFSTYKNTQARAMGESALYIWQNGMTAAGILKFDLSTDTMVCRPQHSGSGTYGSQYSCSHCSDVAI